MPEDFTEVNIINIIKIRIQRPKNGFFEGLRDG